MMFDVKLSMSARGIIIAPLDDPDGEWVDGGPHVVVVWVWGWNSR